MKFILYIIIMYNSVSLYCFDNTLSKSNSHSQDEQSRRIQCALQGLIKSRTHIVKRMQDWQKVMQYNEDPQLDQQCKDIITRSRYDLYENGLAIAHLFEALEQKNKRRHTYPQEYPPTNQQSSLYQNNILLNWKKYKEELFKSWIP